MVDAGAAITFDGRSEEAQFAHLVHDFAVEFLVTVGFEYPRHQFFLAVGTGRVAHHTFFVGQQLVEQQRVIPLEGGFGR